MVEVGFGCVEVLGDLVAGLEGAGGEADDAAALVMDGEGEAVAEADVAVGGEVLAGGDADEAGGE